MFTTDDLTTLAALVADTWRSAAERDWSVQAGTVEWSCQRTAAHAVDCVLAPALFLASRRTDAYPEWEIQVEPGPAASPETLAEACEGYTRMLNGLVLATPTDVRAIIWRRPTPELRGPADFVPRAAVELLLHAHDVCTGLGVAFEPPGELCERLRVHVQDWPYFGQGGWPRLSMTGDPWEDLLETSGRG